MKKSLSEQWKKKMGFSSTKHRIKKASRRPVECRARASNDCSGITYAKYDICSRCKDELIELDRKLELIRENPEMIAQYKGYKSHGN